MRQDLVDHRGLRDARHDPHRAGPVRTHKRVDFEDLPQQRRPPAIGAYCLYRRRLLGEIARVGARAITSAIRALSDERSAS